MIDRMQSALDHYVATEGERSAGTLQRADGSRRLRLLQKRQSSHILEDMTTFLVRQPHRRAKAAAEHHRVCSLQAVP